MGPLNITHETDHELVVKLLLEVRRDIETSLFQLEDMNVGLAKMWAGQALDKLPQDTDQGVQWTVFE